MERHITADHEVRASLDQVGHVLDQGIATVMETRPAGPHHTPATCSTEVEADIGGGRSLHQKVLVSMLSLPSTSDPEARRWELTWQPEQGSRLVPSFRGVLEVNATAGGAHLHLSGSYRSPLGPVGTFGDGLVGHRVAGRTVASFLARLAKRIDTMVDRRPAAVGLTPPYPEDLRDRRLSTEAWIG